MQISEDNLRASVKSSYASVLVLEDVVKLLDSSLKNIENLAAMTQRSVEVGAAEQTTADQILVGRWQPYRPLLRRRPWHQRQVLKPRWGGD